MTTPRDSGPDPLADALIAARLCAIDPGLGGMIIRGGGDLRDGVIAALSAAMPDGAPLRRMPLHIDDDRLLGGIDLTATLAHGRAVSRVGLLAEANGGVVVAPMAERVSDAVAGRIAAAIDTGEITIERDGATMRAPARFVLVALDDGSDPDERPPAALAERLAFWLDLTMVEPDRPDPGAPVPDDMAVASSADAFTAIAATAAALGIDSARAPLFALRAARAAARLAGRDAVTQADLALAVRLVFPARATRMPVAEDDPVDQAPPTQSDRDNGDEESGERQPLDDIMLAAALAALPKDVLARIGAGRRQRSPARRGGGAGERRKSGARGRPMAARAGVPGGGLRLSLIDTLRAAAPMQRLREGDARIKIRRADLRIRRFETRAQAVTVFAVDASGSSALARLAEAKGAVELLLAQAYVKRAEVALVAFRGTSAQLLLPPTRSLARARRALADLPGGGGTPLAAGLNAARELAESARARGWTPFVVILTDGRANIAADGSAVRQIAQADALAAAKAIGEARIAGAFVDISARPRPEGAALAAAMGARYLPLPRADAATMHAAVSAVRDG